MKETGLTPLDRALAPVFRVGSAVARSAFRIGGVSLIAAVVLTLGLASVGYAGPWWIWAAILLAAAGFSAPGLILLVFGQSLHQLLSIPSALADHARAGLDKAKPDQAFFSGGPLRRLWLFGLHLYRMRDVFLESSGQIAQTALLVRLANPVTAVVVLASIGITCVLVPVAAIVLLVVLF